MYFTGLVEATPQKFGPREKGARGNKNNNSRENYDQVNKYQCVICDIDYKISLNYNKHIRDDTWSIFYRIEEILTKYFPNDGSREFPKTNSDLKTHMNYHTHITDKEKLIKGAPLITDAAPHK